MMENDKKIRKGLSARRDPTCYRVEQDIVIPAGTILRHAGGNDFAAPVGHGEFLISMAPGAAVPAEFKRVVA